MTIKKAILALGICGLIGLSGCDEDIQARNEIRRLNERINQLEGKSEIVDFEDFIEVNDYTGKAKVGNYMMSKTIYGRISDLAKKDIRKSGRRWYETSQKDKNYVLLAICKSVDSNKDKKIQPEEVYDK
jgi:hypothetical protein